MVKSFTRSRSRKTVTAVIMTMVFAALVSGVFSNRAEAADKEVLVLARSMDLNSLDPHRAWCDTCKVVNGIAYETLIKLGKDNKTIEPGVAKSWEAGADGMSYTFHLDERAVFSDGSPVESKDVKWSLFRLKHMKAGPDMYAKTISRIDTPDPHTVVITVSGWPSELLAQLVVPYAGVVNSDVAKAHGADNGPDAIKDKAEPWFLKNSAGSAPFVLESYRPDEEVRYIRNENYWKKKPALKQIIIKQVKDAVSQAQMLESGSVDIAMQIDADTAKMIRSKDVVIKSQPSYYFIYVGMFPAAKTKTALTLKIRQAIGYALDYEGLINVTVGGAGRVQPSVVPVEFPGGSGLPMPKRDLEKARKLLAEAGVPNGFDVNLVYLNMTQYGVDFNILVQKIQQDLKKVGIKVNLIPVPGFPQWIEHRSKATMPMTIIWWAADYVGTAPYVQYFSMTPGSRWLWMASNTGPDMPELINKREVALVKKLQTATARKAGPLYHEMAKEMVKDRIVIPLVNPNLLLTYRKNVKGMRYDIITELSFYEIYKQ